jgi:CBS domain-containing protein
MTLVADLIADRKLYAVDTDDMVVEAARLMSEHRIGALPVLHDGELVGVFSERDIVSRVVAGARHPGATPVAEVMTPNPRTVSIDEDVETCLFVMCELGFRHLPVCEGKTVKGMLSLQDIMFHDLKTKRARVA